MTLMDVALVAVILWAITGVVHNVVIVKAVRDTERAKAQRNQLMDEIASTFGEGQHVCVVPRRGHDA